jgi:hypothetical protein
MNNQLNASVRLFLVSSMLLTASSAVAQSGRGGGYLILDEAGQFRLQDLYKRSGCKDRSFQSLASKSVHWEAMLTSLEKHHWYLADFIRREAKALNVCFTGALKVEYLEDLYKVQYPESVNWKSPVVRARLGARLGDTVLIDEALYNLFDQRPETGGLTEQERALFLAHEVLHGVIPDINKQGRPRSELIEDLSSGIYQLVTGNLNAAGLDALLEKVEAQVPASYELNRFVSLREPIHVALSRDTSIRERYLAFSQIPLKEISQWIAPIEINRIAQNSKRELFRINQILDAVEMNSPDFMLDLANTALQQELSKGILPWVRVITVDQKIQSLIDQATQMKAHPILLQALYRQFEKDSGSQYGSASLDGLSKAQLMVAVDVVSHQRADVKLSVLLAQGLDVNAIVPGTDVTFFSYVIEQANWPAFNDVLTIAQSGLSWTTIEAALSPLAKHAEAGNSSPLLRVMGLRKFQMKPIVLQTAYHQGYPVLFNELLKKYNAAELTLVVDETTLDTVGHQLARSVHPTEVQKKMLYDFFSIQSLPVNQLNRDQRSMVDESVKSGAAEAAAQLLVRPDVNWTPRTEDLIRQYAEVKLVLDVLFQSSSDSITRSVEAFSKIAKAETVLTKRDWSDYWFRAQAQQSKAAYLPIIKAKLGVK